MEVDSWIQANTLIVGWKFYNILWDLLVTTGLVFLPVVLLIGNTFMSARSRGAMSNVNAGGVLAEFEMTLFKLFLVMLFVGMPAAVGLKAGETIKMFDDPNDLLRSSTVTDGGACNTNSTNDEVFASYCADSVRVPLWWYLTQYVSQGLTMSVVREVAEQNNNAHRALQRFKIMANIKDPDTREKVGIMRAECLTKAEKEYERLGNEGEEDADKDGVDFSWIGSEYVVGNYYPTTWTTTPIRGMAYDAEADFSVETYGDMGTVDGDAISPQRCSTLWSHVVGQITENEADPWMVSVWNRLGVGMGLSASEEKLVETYVKQTPENNSAVTSTMASLPEGWVARASDGLGKMFASVSLARNVVKTSMYVDVLIVGLPILQAYILMLVIMALPIGFIFSAYSMSFVIQATFLIFSISFWPALWAVASWADEVMARSIFPSGDGLWAAIEELVQSGPSAMVTLLAHNIVTMALYLIAPIAFSWVILAAGGHVAANATGQIGRGTSNLGSGGYGGLASASGRAGRLAAGTYMSRTKGK